MASPSSYGELEIGLYRLDQDLYQAEIRVTDPGSEAAISPARGPARLAVADLRSLQDEPARYAEALTAQLFADTAVRELYVATKAAFESRGLMLRLRILIGAGAPELHAIRWELLSDPQTKAPLATSERILLSRFMMSRDWRLVDLRPRQDLKTVIAVSAPTNSADYGLALVPKEKEIARVRQALGASEPAVLGDIQPLTLESLMAALRGGVDIVYLVCHGVLLNGVEPWLFLQSETGEVARVSGASLAERIAELRHPPRLMVMASCESAGRAETSTPELIAAAAHSALAPRLAEAGVAAVVAMQGKISMDTVEAAMPAFFGELMKDGQIDRAMAVARGAVRHRHDSWMPALYLRLKSGRIWYEPGFGEGAKEDALRWDAICDSVRKGEFTPILGPELGEDLYGSTRELAGRLAEKHGFPLAERDRTDLAKVAQYIATHQTGKYARTAIAEQFAGQLSRNIGSGKNSETLPELLDLAAARCRARPDHPYTAVAGLSASIYVNAAADPILTRVLRGAGKTPEAVFGPWRPPPRKRDDRRGGGNGDSEVAAIPRAPQPKNPAPTADSPWVYHIFGVLADPATLVMTEDDFFDHLIATTSGKLIPPTVSRHLLQSSLLFLGFRLDDWRFRVLFRMIMTMEGAGSLDDTAHVGVQVNPDEHSLADVERARKYMVDYFRDASTKFSIYWGSAEDFLRELRKRLAETPSVQETPLVKASASDWV